MTKILLGSIKSGWEIDDDKQILTIFYPVSFFEKLKKIEQCKSISIFDIKKISIGWNNIPLAMGENQHFVMLEVTTNNNEIYDFEGTKNGISKELFKEAILLLKNNEIEFEDAYKILDKIINTDESIWNILNEAELKRRKVELKHEKER